MRIVEVLNSYPGEAFIREHARSVLEYSDVDLIWAYVQTSRFGQVPPVVEGLDKSVALFNANRSSTFQKLWVRLRYFNHGNRYGKVAERQLRSLNPDLIHFHFASLAARHIDMVKRLNVPFTFSVRGADLQTDPVIQGAPYIATLTQAANHAAAIHAVTDDLKSTLNTYCGNLKKTHVIRTAIHPSWSLVKRTPVKNLFIAVGRLHWRKGFPDLLLACATVIQSCPDFKLVLIGEGPQRDKLEFMIRDLNLSAHVELAGNKNHDQIQHYFSTAYAFVLSSVEEGFPNVLGEAMLARVPVVSTNLSGITEVLEPGHSGELAQVGNPESLAKAMLQVMHLDDSSLKARCDRAFGKASQLFSAQQHATCFSEFWKKAIKS